MSETSQQYSVPEAVMSIIQLKVFDLVNSREGLLSKVDQANQALTNAKQEAHWNEIQIAQCAVFLQKECPGAVRTNWFDELKVPEELIPESLAKQEHEGA